jgi:hypothetical protein
MKVREIKQTCFACPSQWEGHLDDGRMFYVRYRWGGLRIELSNSPTENISDVFHDGEIIHTETLGDGFDGMLEEEKLIGIMENIGFSF